MLNQAQPVRDRESLLQAAAVKVLAIPLEDARGKLIKQEQIVGDLECAAQHQRPTKDRC